VQRRPALLTDAEVGAFYEASWHARPLTHGGRLTLWLFTGIRHTALVHLRLTDVALQSGQLRMTQGQGPKDRSVLLPTSFRGELAPYLAHHHQPGRPFLVASNRSRPYATRCLRQIVPQDAKAAGSTKRVYPHRCRHPLLTSLTKHGLIRPKLPWRRGHTAEQSLAV
jgi:integrase/recombinase XerD